MTKAILHDFLIKHQLAVLATNSPDNKPEAAVIGIAVSENLEIIFDTVRTARKYTNLLQNPRVSLVIGWENETTVQYEGEAFELKGEDDNKESSKYKELYFSVFPDGRQRAETWPELVHFRIEPRWVRYSNFNDPPLIREFTF